MGSSAHVYSLNPVYTTFMQQEQCMLWAVPRHGIVNLQIDTSVLQMQGLGVVYRLA